ncbi:MAG: PQQ-dependent sugar dehydrogenase [Bdellovibrionota bacterium]
MKTRLLIFIALGLTLMAQLARSAPNENKTYTSEGQKFKYELLKQLGDSAVIWGFDFLSDSEIIFTERSGAIKILNLKDKSVVEVRGAPKVWAKGQGGMLDVRVHPAQKDRIYLTYSEPVEKDKATTAFAVATLKNNELINFKKIISAADPSDEKIHFGSRIEFDGKGHIFITVGERNARKNVLKLGYHTGKVLRFNEDGSVPKDNPYVKEKGAQPEIWSIGHRNPQGLAYNSETAELWLVEMGPRGGDELNLIKPGQNYGWPEVTYGREYYGPKIGVKKKAGTVEPVEFWVPSISPSGMALYRGSVFPKWKGNLFMATLATTHVRRLVMKDGKVVQQEELLKDIGSRFRNIRSGLDGNLYLSTDDGQIARLVAVK